MRVTAAVLSGRGNEAEVRVSKEE